jgi:hypothetical protein
MKRELTHGSLFSGVEGFGLGATLAGIKTEWSCEFEKYQTEVIKKKILEMDYGDTCTELLEKSDPIMSLSKIALCSESEDSSTSYMDFPKSGMMHSGNVYKVA